MKNKRELWIQAALIPFLLFGSSALAVLAGYGDFTLSKVGSTFISAVRLNPGHLEVLLLPVILLLLYNLVVGVILTSVKTIKHRKVLNIRKVATFPLTLLAAFCFLAYGFLSIGRFLEERKTERLIENLFHDGSALSQTSYETRLSPPLDESIFSSRIQEMKIEEDYSLIRLNDGSTLLAVVNENKKIIVITKN